MGRLLVLVVLVVLAVWLVRRALRKPGSGASADKAANVPDQLVRCAHCGLHLPRAEARERAGAMYCSEDHARLGEH